MSLKFLGSLAWFRARTTIVALESAGLKKIEIMLDTYYTNPTGTAMCKGEKAGREAEGGIW